MHCVASWSSSDNHIGLDCVCSLDDSNFVECVNVVSG